MSKTLSVLILGLLLLSSCLEAYNNILRQLQSTSEQSSGIISRCRPLFLVSQPVLSHSNYRNSILRSTDDSVEDPGRERAVKKSKRMARETSEMMRFSEEIVKPWSLSDSFNSTTMKFIFGLKVDRDIKLTFKTGDIIKRKIKKETKIILSGVSEVSKPFLALPAAVQKLSDQKDLWGLVRVGVNPLSEERMLDNFNAKNTKERARLPKKKAVPMLAADSVYRTVRMLPNKLKYDYERKKIAGGIKKNEIESRRENLLSDGIDDYDEDDVMSGGGRRGRGGGGGRIPLLPDTIYSQGQASDNNKDKNRKRKRNSDEDSDFINYDNTGSSTYSTADGIINSDSDSKYNKYNDGYEQLQRGMTMTITEEDAAASMLLIQALRSFSQDVVERGLLLKLKEELLWAVGVAQETLDLEILEAGKKSKTRATPQEGKVKEEMKEGEEEIEVDKKRDEESLEDNNTQDTDQDEDELRRWGIERLISSKDTISNAIDICSRLEDLPLQLKSIVKDKGREKVLRLRVGDIEGLRRGVEAFVGGIPTAATTDSGSGSDSGDSSKNDVGSVSGWGGGQAGVVERIVGNRPLLAGIYGISNGLEETLNEQRNRMEQREYDGQSSVGSGSREDRSRGGGWRSDGEEWDSEQSEQSEQDDSAQRDDEIEVKVKGDDESESIPGGLVKETISRSDDSALGEGEGDLENKGGWMAGKDTRDIPIKATPSPPPPSPPMWSPGAAVMPVSFSPTPPPIATATAATATAATATAADISSLQQKDENITPDISTVTENKDNEDGNANSYRSTLNKTTDGDEREVVEQMKEIKEEAKEEKEELGDDSMSKDDDEGEVYFLSVIDDDNENDDTYSRTRVNKSYSSSGRGDDGSGQRDNSIFDTTIESTRDKDADQIILFLTTSLDVMFFLLETIAKASGPILLGGGAVAAERASDALFADAISPKSFLRKSNRSSNSKDKDKDRDKDKGSNVGAETQDSSSSSVKESSVKTWKLLSEFKQQI